VFVAVTGVVLGVRQASGRGPCIVGLAHQVGPLIYGSPSQLHKKKLWPEQTIDDDVVLCNKLLCMNANQKNQLYYMHAVTKYIVMIKSDKKNHPLCRS
jgi:hypothetical protein